MVIVCNVMRLSLTQMAGSFAKWQLSPRPPRYSALPLDPVTHNIVRPNIPNAVFSKVEPTPLTENVRLVCVSRDCLENILDISKEDALKSTDFKKFIAGEKLPAGAFPVAHRYGGHQFGYWARQLGDGRAHLIGEYINKKNQKIELQLKGSGPTPYSREGDGRAVLRSSIREMIASEACHYLGIPSSRAAALVVSDDKAIRDMFYTGNLKYEKCAIVLRLAPTWFRIGSFELLTKMDEIDILKQLVDYVIEDIYPNIDKSGENRVIQFFEEVAERSLELVARWQGYGFTHGVLNTDNMSLLGITIDYGPYGFVEAYDTQYTPNHSDNLSRYCLGNQPNIVVWNLIQLAIALQPLLNEEQQTLIGDSIKDLKTRVSDKVTKFFLRKLGLETVQDGDEELVNSLLNQMEETKADFTMTFNQLGQLNPNSFNDRKIMKNYWALSILCKSNSWSRWVNSYQTRLTKEQLEEKYNNIEDQRIHRMKMINPRYIPRNWMLQNAINLADKDDFSQVNFLLKIFENPFEINEEAEKLGFASKPPEWASSLTLSCSS